MISMRKAPPGLLACMVPASADPSLPRVEYHHPRRFHGVPGPGNGRVLRCALLYVQREAFERVQLADSPGALLTVHSPLYLLCPDI